MVNSEVIKGLQPELVWKHLAEIAEIPRGSRNEEAVRAYVLGVAKKYGLESKIDAVGNLLVKKPATVGHENAPSIALQGHLDMVCEKNSDVAHDFLKDPIRFVRNGDIIKASGTTAGFDNGIAVAVMCAIMEETTLAHGPLEMLFTVDEETGLTGANGLEPGFLASKTLLNLDTEEEGQLYIGCAGGKQTIGVAKYSTREPPVGSLFYTLQVSGLRGGHSGCDIHENRGNALKIIGEILDTLHDMNDVTFVSVSGGDKHNAIPREAEALIVIQEGMVKKVRRTLDDLKSYFNDIYCDSEPKLEIFFRRHSRKNFPDAKILHYGEAKRFLGFLAHVQNGVIKMSEAVPGLVETSTNLAAVRYDNGFFTIVTSQRSSINSELEKNCDEVAKTMRNAKMTVQIGEGYPGWEPNAQSPILLQATKVYESLFGKKPLVKAIHAGLECGVIGEKYPGMDMLSIGPTIENPHSPDERMHVSTVPKFWEFLVALLADIK
jgi:dipeptidase D